MPVRIRCALTLWEHAGAYYAIPEEDGLSALMLRQWAESVGAARLREHLVGGLPVEEHRLIAEVLVECKVAGKWVLAPRALLDGLDD
jgi:hypothetical protein